ncbi:carboxypeptidase regulatory-like domain-containing protein [Candidatus Hydrogenedentota bacterium]
MKTSMTYQVYSRSGKAKISVIAGLCIAVIIILAFALLSRSDEPATSLPTDTLEQPAVAETSPPEPTAERSMVAESEPVEVVESTSAETVEIVEASNGQSLADLLAKKFKEAEKDSKKVAQGGTGKFRGYVLKAGGETVGGAPVKALHLGGWSEPLDLDEAPVTKTKSSPDGSFEFTHLADGSYVLFATAEGLVGHGRGYVNSYYNYPQSFDIILGPAASIAGTVVGPDGGPVADAKVVPVVRKGGGQYGNDTVTSISWVPTDSAGKFVMNELVAGEYTIQARAEGFAPKSLEKVKTGTTDLRIVLTAGGRISGIVTQAGHPAEGIKAVAVNTSGMGYGSLGKREETTVDENGSYELSALAEGKYYVAVWGDELSAKMQTDISLSDGEHKGNVNFELVENGALSGTVFEAETGEPLINVMVMCNQDGQSLSSMYFTDPDKAKVHTDLEGKYRFDSIPPGSYSVRVAKAGDFIPPNWDEREAARVESGQETTGVDIELHRGAVAGITVRSEEGEPISMAMVSLQSTDPADRYGYSGSLPMGEDVGGGRYQIKGIRPGTFRVIASKRGYAQGKSEDINIAGPTDRPNLEIVLPRGLVVTGMVIDENGAGIEGARLRFRPRNDTGSYVSQGEMTTTTDEKGSFTLEGATPGKNHVNVTAAGYNNKGKDVSLRKGGDPIELTLEAEGPHFVAGVVKNDLGKAVMGVQVNAYQSGGQTYINKRGTTDKDGKFRVEGFGEGTVRINMWSQEGAQKNSQREFEVDREDIEIIIERYATAKGRVLDSSGLSVSQFRAYAKKESQNYGPGHQGSAFTKGEFELTNVAPGRSVVVVAAEGYAEMISDAFTVGPAESIDGIVITLGSAGGISGVALTKGSREPVAGAKVYAKTGGLPRSEWELSRIPTKTRTGPEGAFEILGLKAGKVDVRVTGGGGGTGSVKEVDVEAGLVTNGVEVFVDSGGEIFGYVTKVGKKLPDVRVYSYPSTGGSMTTESTTDGEGYYVLKNIPTGRHSVTVSLGSDSDSSVSTRQTVKIEEGESVQQDFNIPDNRGGIEGIVYVDDEAKAGVRVYADLQQENPGRGGQSEKPGIHGSSESEKGGKFSIAGLPSGTYNLRAYYRVGSNSRSANTKVDVEAAVIFADLQIGGQGSGAISGYVTDDGEPVPDKYVSCDLNEGETNYDSNSRTDSDGYYEFKDVPAGEVSLRVYISGGGRGGRSKSKRVTLQLDEGESLEHNFEFVTGTGVITGSVFQNGESVAGSSVKIKVQLRMADNSSGDSPSANVADGTYRIEALTPGRYIASVMWQPGADKRTITRYVDIENDTEINMDFDFDIGTATITGRVEGPKSNSRNGTTRVYIFEAGTCTLSEGSPFKSFLDLDGGIEQTNMGRGGEFKIAQLTAGDYDVAAIRYYKGAVVKIDKQTVHLSENQTATLNFSVVD